MKKIKKVIYLFLTNLMLTIQKVYASITLDIQPMYGVSTSTVSFPESIREKIQKLGQKTAIPIILLIGIIIYFIKSKKSIKHKIIILLAIAGLYLIFRIDIYLICENITCIFDL